MSVVLHEPWPAAHLVRSAPSTVPGHLAGEHPVLLMNFVVSVVAEADRVQLTRGPDADPWQSQRRGRGNRNPAEPEFRGQVIRYCGGLQLRARRVV